MGHKHRKRQAQLTFNPLSAESPAAAAYNQQIRDRAAAVRYEGSPSPAFKRRRTEASPPVRPPVMGRQIQTRIDKHTEKRMRRLPSESDDGRAAVMSTTITSDESETEHAVISTVTQAHAHTSPRDRQNIARPTQFFSKHLEVPASRAGKGKAKKQSTLTRVQQRFPSSSRMNHESSLSESEQEDMPLTPASRKRQTKIVSPKASPILPYISDNDTDGSPPEIISSRTRKHKRPVVSHPSPPDSASDSDSELPNPKKRKLRQRRQEQNEIEADAQDLHNSSDLDMGPISSQSAKRNAQQQALRNLKRRRAGQHAFNPNANQRKAADQDDTNDDTSPDEENDVMTNDEANEDDDDDESIYINARQIFQATEEDEQFLTDAEANDEDDENGMTAMPMQFSSYASMKTKELFKYAVEWMVSKKINPAFQQKDEIYVLTFYKLDDEVKYLAGSKFMSAAWTAQFSYALRARPQIAYAHLQGQQADQAFLRDKCDACNRSGHPATYSLQFLGKPYDNDTLEELGNDDSDVSDISSDNDEHSTADKLPSSSPARDMSGRTIVAEDHIFYVGKFCMSNAETAHALQHWRHHLYEWVCDYLESEGQSTPEQIVKRDKWNERKRRKFVNKLVDEMERNGKIKELWAEFRSQVDRARDAKQGRF